MGWGQCLAVLVLSAPTAAMADEPTTTEEHRALMISAQVMQKEGKLLRARELLATCASATCAEAAQASECEEIRAFCGKRMTQVTGEIPTVRVRVEDDRGRPIQAELLEVDALAAAPSSVLSLDPGPHAVKALSVGRSGEAAFVLERGQKNAPIVVQIDLRETLQHRPLPAPVYVLGATAVAAGLLGLGTGVYTARSYQALDSCKPYCDSSQESKLRTTGSVADISLAVTLASAVAGTIWLLARPTVTEYRWLRAPADPSPR